MAAPGKVAWLALTNRKHSAASRSPARTGGRQAGRGFSHDGALPRELLHLASQPRELLALGRGERAGTFGARRGGRRARIDGGLRDPGADGRLGGLELLGERLGRAAGLVQRNDLRAELGRVRRTGTGHGGASSHLRVGLHRNGSTPVLHRHDDHGTDGQQQNQSLQNRTENRV